MKTFINRLGMVAMVLGISLVLVPSSQPTALADPEAIGNKTSGEGPNRASAVMPEGLRQAVLSRLQAIEPDPDAAKAYRANNPVQGLSIRFGSGALR